MTGSLFRRLLLMAVALIAVTLFAIDHALVGTDVRGRVFAIALCSSLLALLVAFLVSQSLARRVRNLKQVAEGILDRPHEDSSDDLGSLETSIAGVAKELRRLLDRLRFESARREAILSSMAEGVLAVDPDLRVTFCNTAFLRAIGFRGGAFEGLSLLELVRDTGLHKLLREVLETGEPQKLRFKLTAAYGRTFEVQATSLAMPTGRGTIAILQHIT